VKTEKTGSDLTAIEDHVEALKKQEKTVPFFCELCLIRCASQGLATTMLDHHERGGTAAGSLAEAERSL
jgi:hypothetical protein